MTFAYTHIVSDIAPIHLSVLLILDEDAPYYTMPSLTFKTENGVEIESWDNDKYLIEFYHNLKSNQWDNIDLSDSEIDQRFIRLYRDEIIELFELAQKAKMICLT